MITVCGEAERLWTTAAEGKQKAGNGRGTAATTASLVGLARGEPGQLLATSAADQQKAGGACGLDTTGPRGELGRLCAAAARGQQAAGCDNCGVTTVVTAVTAAPAAAARGVQEEVGASTLTVLGAMPRGDPGRLDALLGVPDRIAWGCCPVAVHRRGRPGVRGVPAQELQSSRVDAATNDGALSSSSPPCGSEAAVAAAAAAHRSSSSVRRKLSASSLAIRQANSACIRCRERSASRLSSTGSTQLSPATCIRGVKQASSPSGPALLLSICAWKRRIPIANVESFCFREVTAMAVPSPSAVARGSHAAVPPPGSLLPSSSIMRARARRHRRHRWAPRPTRPPFPFS
mmetsp:Transcript_118525/g.264997  ORF Transcript_118525/g.264997 Transcript_118525/m.264997 type:complete len:347 (-) Transcript_118525:18-1058(-)